MTSLLILALAGADWTNPGGIASRCCLTVETGPAEEDLLWSGGRPSLIAWQPVTEGDLVFAVRQAAWPGSTGDSPVVCMDLSTGAEQWAVDIPYVAGDWITWIAGVSDGLVYASRSGNGASVSAHLYALDTVDGSVEWVSDALIDAGPYDGVVFAPDGDPIIASFQDIWRIDSGDGSTVWHSPRTGSVSGQCGGCLSGDGFYVVDAVGGGHAFVKYDPETGAELYQGPVMPGFTAQCTPMAGPDGTLYFNRTQNNPGTDYFYAFEDTGTGFAEKWHVAAANACAPEFGAGPGGTVYFVIPGPCLAGADADYGTILAQTDTIPGYSACRLAVDAAGNVFMSNGGFSGGHLYVFTADLEPLWDTAVPGINIGGPAIGASGTLVVCGTGTDVRAYRSGTGVHGEPSGGSFSVSASPNPSPGPVTISVEGAPGEVTVVVADLAGRVVARPATPAPCDGRTEIGWAPGASIPSGIYLVRASSGGSCATARLVVTGH
jgi:hypothetical protein